jgi:enolase
MAATIQSVKARQIFDSRGNPTVEVRARGSTTAPRSSYAYLRRRGTRPAVVKGDLIL